jgi:nucleoside-diphosphate-sugar epimerase
VKDPLLVRPPSLTAGGKSHTIPDMKVLVTGGTGFVGSHLVDRLLEDPDTEVHALVRNPAKTRWLEGRGRVRFLEGDILNVPELPSGLSVVFHLAGLTKTHKSSEYYTVNQAGTASLFRALAGLAEAPRVVHVSSLAAAGPSSPGRPRREDDPPRPVSPYGISKLRGELEALGFKDRVPLAVLRIGALYGPRDEDFLDLFRWVRRGVLPLFGRRKKSLSLLHVRDAVRAILLAAGTGAPSGEIFNIADAGLATWDEMGETAARILGRKVVRVRIPDWAAFLGCAAADGVGRLRGRATTLNLGKYEDMKPDNWTADVRKARELLGFESRISLEEGLRETLDWYARNGLL